jgi:ligand-binding sensor domain-containing protein/signal transduction histidine kinase
MVFLRRTKINALLVFLLIIATTRLFTITPQDLLTSNNSGGIQFERMSIENGLSQVSVNCIAQDSMGFIWVGTNDGLNRYDGYTFTTYKHEINQEFSLSDSHIRVIYVERDKNILWVGTANGGINKFDPETGFTISYSHYPSNPGSISHNEVTAIYEDRDGTIWIGTWGGGLNKFNREKGSFTSYTHDPDNPHSISSDVVRAILQDREGRMWIGTYGGGLNLMEPQTGHFTRFRSQTENMQSLSDDRVITIYEAGEGEFWVGTDGGGLNLFDRKTGRFTRYKHNPGNPHSLSNNRIRAVIEDKNGVLWIGTLGGGLNVFDRQNRQFTAFKYDPLNLYSLANNEVQTIFEDNTGILWVGTRVGGLNKYDSQRKKFKVFKYNPLKPNFLSAGKIRAIHVDADGTLWLGTNGGGLNKWKQGEGWTQYRNETGKKDSLSHDRVYVIEEDKNRNLWVGTFGGGLNKLDKQRKVFTHYKHNPADSRSISHNRVRTICEDNDGLLWIGTWEGGLNKFYPEKEEFVRYKYDPKDIHSLSYNKVYCLFVDGKGVLWIGTWGGGLNRYNKDIDGFTRFRRNEEEDNGGCLSSDRVFCIYENKVGAPYLWVGTEGEGLNRFDVENNRWKTYTVKHGLPNDVIYGILEDEDGHLWLSTNKGISRFHMASEIFKNYDTTDGLQSDEFNGGAYYKSKNGVMYFGGVNGFNCFLPADIADNSNIPPVYITGIKVLNKPINLENPISRTEEIKISSRENYFSISFVALNYRTTEKNRYAYRMDNFDDKWVFCGNNTTAGYTNLDGGTYMFRVKASNNDDVWNEEGASIRVIIQKPYWQTWWFRGGGILLFLFLTIHLYRRKKTNSERDNRKIEILFNRLKQENQERSQVEKALKEIEEKYRRTIENISGSEKMEEQNKEMLKQLANAKKMTAVGNLAGGMAHEFNNLIAVISGNANLLERNCGKDSPYKKQLQAIVNAADRCATLTHQLLSFSKKQILNLQELDLNKLLLSMKTGIRNQMGEMVDVVFKLTPKLSRIKVDHEMMELVISRIVENSRDAMPDGGKLTIVTRDVVCMENNSEGNPGYRKGEFVLLSIMDTGSGMDEETLSQIFDPFFTTKNVGEGTGLNLSFVYGTVSQHDGWLDVKSKAGEGTTMMIYIPVFVEKKD